MEDKKPLLYVYADIRHGMDTWSAKHLQNYLEGITNQLVQELPEYRVMVGIIPLSFTVVDPKQEFVEKLKGTIPTSI